MDVNAVITMISSVGMPAVICIFFLWRLNKQDDKFYGQLEELKKTVDNNTSIVNELVKLMQYEVRNNE